MSLLKETPFYVPIGRPLGVQFSVMSGSLMKNFEHLDLLNAPQQKIFEELNKKSLGVVFREDGECERCHGGTGDFVGEMPCPGHFGFMKINQQKMFHPLLIDKLATVMSLFCTDCRRLKALKYYENLGFKEVEQQKNAVRTFLKQHPQFRRIPELFELSENVQCCSKHTRFKSSKDSGVFKLLMNEEIKDKKITVNKDSGGFKEVTPYEAYNTMVGYFPEDIEIIGLKNSPPVNMIMEYIPVAPRCIRPTIVMDGKSNNDQLTDMYSTVANAIQKITDPSNLNNSLEPVEGVCKTYAKICKSSKGEETSEKTVKGIMERLKGKYGRLRNNCMGKRVNFCSRSVISGDPTISIDQLGVPKSTAKRLSFPEIVTERNREFLQKLVDKPTEYPGANVVEKDGSIQRLDQGGVQQIQLEIGDKVHRHLMDGDYVMFNRQPSLHKMSFMCHRAKILPYSTFRLNLCATKPYNADFDGDEMNMHEPQHLQAISEMGEIMLVSKQVVSCKSNGPLMSIVQDSLVGCQIMSQRDKFINRADFQKYQMFLSFPDNKYRPQSTDEIKRKTEGDETLIPGFSITQSSLSSLTFSNQSASFSATVDEDPIEAFRRSFYASVQDLDNPTFVSMKTPQPAVMYPQNLWTGKQLFSMSLPSSINLSIGSSVIRGQSNPIIKDEARIIINGEFVCGIVNNSVIGQAQGGLIHVLFKDYSPDACRTFMDNCQRTVTQFMADHSFSVGFGDMVISKEAKQNCQNVTNDFLAKVDLTFEKSVNGGFQLKPGCSHENVFEGEINQVLTKASADMENIVKQDLPKRNALLQMVTSGSKGKFFNVLQIAAGLGQQQLNANRMKYKFLTFRSLPHFQPFDYLIDSRGFVRSSFIQGLTLTEFLFHMTGGREGVCDTAIKTADSGYVERKMMKNMESLGLMYDGSVRDDTNKVVQIRYGEDSSDPHLTEKRDYDLILQTDIQFWNQTFLDYRYLRVQPQKKLFDQLQEQQQRQEFEFTELISQVSDNFNNTYAQDNLFGYVLRDSRFQEFLINVDPDVVPAKILADYVHTHVNYFIEKQRTDPTRPYPMQDASWDLKLYLTDDNIQEALENSDIMMKEYIALLVERCWLIYLQQYILESTNAKTAECAKNTSCDIIRVITRFQNEKLNNKTPIIIADELKSNSGMTRAVFDEMKSNISPVYVVQTVNKLLKRLKSRRDQESKLFRVLIRQLLASKLVCYKYRLNQTQFDSIIQVLEQKFCKNQCSPGEGVGPLASHSISEPATQLTLNTFHTAGTSALGNLGLPRLKELIDFRDTKIPIMTIHLNYEHGNIPIFIENSSESSQRAQNQSKLLKKIGSQLENCKFSDFVEKFTLCFEPAGEDLKIPDYWWLNLKQVLEGNKTKQLSPFVLRYEIMLKKLIEYQDSKLGICQICEILKSIDQRALEGTKFDEIDVKYYPGIGSAVVRIRPIVEEHDQFLFTDNLYKLNDLIMNCHISGMPKIKKVFQNSLSPYLLYGMDKFTPKYEDINEEFLRKLLRIDNDQFDVVKAKDDYLLSYMKKFGGIKKGGDAKVEKNDKLKAQVEELYIQTEGSDLQAVLNLEDVDAKRTFCNDLPELYRVLGVEACRNLLANEMAATLGDNSINKRHYIMLADIMTAHPVHNKLIGINRHGMSITNTGVLAQASFEMPGEIFMQAGVYGLRDPCKSISSAVLLGCEMAHGTGAFELLLDTASGILPPPPDAQHAHPRSLVKKDGAQQAAAAEQSQAAEQSAFTQRGISSYSMVGSHQNSVLNIFTANSKSRFSQRQSQASMVGSQQRSAMTSSLYSAASNNRSAASAINQDFDPYRQATQRSGDNSRRSNRSAGVSNVSLSSFSQSQVVSHISAKSNNKDDEAEQNGERNDQNGNDEQYF